LHGDSGVGGGGAGDLRAFAAVDVDGLVVRALRGRHPLLVGPGVTVAGVDRCPVRGAQGPEVRALGATSDHDLPAAKALEARRVEAYDRLLELITRAKNTGYLREDSTHQDVVILLIANAGVVTATGDSAPDTWRRLVGHMIRSYAAPGAPIPPLS
jgi:hypothetical protein